jgi:hypothetical protein
MVLPEFRLYVLIFHQHFYTHTLFSKHEIICVSTCLIQGSAFHFADIRIILTLKSIQFETLGIHVFDVVDSIM